MTQIDHVLLSKEIIDQQEWTIEINDPNAYTSERSKTDHSSMHRSITTSLPLNVEKKKKSKINKAINQAFDRCIL